MLLFAALCCVVPLKYNGRQPVFFTHNFPRRQSGRKLRACTYLRAHILERNNQPYDDNTLNDRNPINRTTLFEQNSCQTAISSYPLIRPVFV